MKDKQELINISLCPYCRKNIKHLIGIGLHQTCQDVSLSGDKLEYEIYFDDNGRINKYQFYCPECVHFISNNQTEIIKFLMGKIKVYHRADE